MANRGKLRGAPVVGVGINATDTIIRLPRFPTLDSKVEILSAQVRAGGQVASAMVACRRWGRRARYVGKIGGDAAGKFQMQEMRREGVDAHWIVADDSTSQTAYVLVDEPSGERTILWKRDASIALRPGDLTRRWISGARILLVDGHDTAAATRAARWASQEKITVVADLDNPYSGVQVLLRIVDFPVTSKDFPERLTRERDLLKSLPKIQREFKCRMIVATLGRMGAVAWNGTEFLHCPGFRVKAIDTTGAGDIFHGAFVYSLAQGFEMKEALEFSCSAAAINCTAPGARGKIGTLEEIARLRKTGARSEPAFTSDALREAGAAARAANACAGARGNGRKTSVTKSGAAEIIP